MYDDKNRLVACAGPQGLQNVALVKSDKLVVGCRRPTGFAIAAGDGICGGWPGDDWLPSLAQEPPL
jgi:hypothetical protein